MNTEIPSAFVSAERIRYRHIYLHPNAYSDEKIVVGVVGQSETTIEMRFISSASAIDLLGQLIGADGVEQFNFAIGEVRRRSRDWSDIADLDSLPSDLLTVGETRNAITASRASLYKDILEDSSVLYRSYSASGSTRETVGQTSLTKSLQERVNQLNPWVADGLFSKRKISTIDGDTVEVPIFGNKIFGAPVSFFARDFSEPRMRAEAYVAKFNWLKSFVPQEPRVYVLAPIQTSQSNVNRLEASMRELIAISNAASVPLRHGETTDELAAKVLSDEAA